MPLRGVKPVANRRRLVGSARSTSLAPPRRISPVAGDCVVELVGLEPTTKVLWNMVRVRPSTLVGQPPPLLGQVAFALPRRSGWVSDQGSWSDTTIFHNTLVVGSSPTSSTTQSPATGEIIGSGRGNLRHVAQFKPLQGLTSRLVAPADRVPHEPEVPRPRYSAVATGAGGAARGRLL